MHWLFTLSNYVTEVCLVFILIQISLDIRWVSDIRIHLDINKCWISTKFPISVKKSGTSLFVGLHIRIQKSDIRNIRYQHMSTKNLTQASFYPSKSMKPKEYSPYNSSFGSFCPLPVTMSVHPHSCCFKISKQHQNIGIKLNSLNIICFWESSKNKNEGLTPPLYK